MAFMHTWSSQVPTSIAWLGYLAYEIVASELFAERTLAHGTRTLGYGQVAALVLISPSVMEVIRLVFRGLTNDHDLQRTPELPEGARS
jgi:hypothetical protein